MSKQELVTLRFPPGLYQNGTRRSARQYWHRANLMRFKDGVARVLGGWAQQNANAATGRVNSCFAWLDNSSNGWLAVGTESKLYVYDDDFTRYDITPVGFVPGTADEGSYTGYGVGAYGSGLYSVPQPLVGGIPTPASTWSFDAWGENLVAQFCGSGQIYEWALNTGTPAAVVSNSPSGNQAIVVTDERILLAFGADNDARAIKGSDSEDNTDWTPAIDNQSIDRAITSSSKIVTVRKFKGDILIWTQNALYRGSYIRPPYIYEFSEVGNGCAIAGRNAPATVDERALWWGKDNFWQWDGGSLSPLPCPILDELVQDVNTSQRSKIFAMVNSTHSEVTWLYPSSANTECDSYVTYSYAENHWIRGTIDRLVGVDRGTFPRPFMLDSTGLLYEHEIEGGSLGGVTPFLESGPFELGLPDGRQLYTIHKFWPDDTDENDALDAAATLSMYLKAQIYPRGDIRTVGPFDNETPAGTRITGRQIALRLEGTTGVWRLGDYRMLYSLRGER